jgi:hypothetical protein
MRNNHRMKLVIACALVAALAPAPADACSCGRQSVWSVIEKTAPPNTHVMLWFADRVYKTAPTFTLREADKKAEVATDRRDVKSGAFTIADLAPRRALKAKTGYEVVDQDGQVVLEFTTTAKADTKAPAWTGMTADYVKQPGACCMCNTGYPYIQVKATGATDDGGAERIVYAVWTADTQDGAKIPAFDYSKPPQLYVRAWRGEFDLGHSSTCSRNNFDIATGKVIKLGVRPIDLAGNAGPAREVLVDLSQKPTEIPD